MTILPINGKNERLGKLFKAPKHLLLKDGIPAVRHTYEYMQRFGLVTIICNAKYEEALGDFNRIVIPETDNVIETLRHGMPANFNTDLWIVDCDIIPAKLNRPKGNTVYLFENKEKKLHYSNFEVRDGKVLSCNEKESLLPWAGAGIYYFRTTIEFMKHWNYCKNVSDVIRKMIASNVSVHADTTSEIFRFGTLHDINGL